MGGDPVPYERPESAVEGKGSEKEIEESKKREKKTATEDVEKGLGEGERPATGRAG